MSTTEKNRNRLITLLKELFQLDQPELDFGLYKIMHAKSEQITTFLQSDLLKQIEAAFGDLDQQHAAEAKANYEAAIEQAKKFGAPNPDETQGVQEAKSAYENAKDKGNAENEIYDHLYRFFERYYDSGDFMSRRYYARESDSRAAPYSVPYDGREVYLHWANKDQYYIKSSEYLSNYTFELNAAIRQEAQKTKGAGLEAFATIDDEQPLKVHFRIIDASEGEHGNIKAASDQKRFFHIHEDAPIVMDNGELVIQFHYRADAEKTGQDNKWQEKLLEQAELAILKALKADASANGFWQGLSRLAPTDSKSKRTLLGKYLYQYAARNTMDYFIHKDLGGFMRRELDFYIKNEIMRLDDIENADAPKVEQYLAQIRVLRRIAQQLIAFLSQLEDFQLKLWLKKKFVTETHYCITLDRVPEKFYAEIAANDKQREEWVKLFVIDEIKEDLVNLVYSDPLTLEFLKANLYLLVDTALFDEDFKQKLLAEIPDLDAQCDGVLIHSENFQALGLMQQKYREQVKCIYIDPPYNTNASEIAYKNGYKDSSWGTLINDRVSSSFSLLKIDGIHCFTIDDFELDKSLMILAEKFGSENHLATSPVRNNPQGRSTVSGFSVNHEYAIFHRKSERCKSVGRLTRSDEQIERYDEIDDQGRRYLWENFRKTGTDSSRRDRPKQFYPLMISQSGEIKIPNMNWDELTGWVLTDDIDISLIIYPIDSNSHERCWKWGIDRARNEINNLKTKMQAGNWEVYRKNFLNEDGKLPGTWWDDVRYAAGSHGTNLLTALFGSGRNFLFPKSVYAVQDCILVSTGNQGQMVLDYFAGSGTSGHAVININREDNGKRKYILVEQNNYFDTVLKPRIQKVVYSKDWKEGKPVSREGISHCFKTLRLESYEDTLNNLILKADSSRDTALANNADLQRNYLLNYFLDVETQASQSLLNIADFRDPTAYKMNIKKPGSEEQSLQAIDLIETFNWLIGLWVQNMAAPHSFSAEFEREHDADLPKDQNTRLLCKRLKADDNGDYWFRLIEGYTLKVPGDDTSKVATLIVWRKQTDDAEKDNAVLQKFLLEKLQISPREHTYGVIYINGSHTLPNPVVEGEQTKVRLIEEAFHNAMWAGEAV